MSNHASRALPVVAALLLAGAPAAAQQAEGRFRVGVTAGTLGIGPEVGYRLSERLGIRGNATFFGYGDDVDVDDIRYTGSLKLRSFGAMIDLHPFAGGFRISAGARSSRNRVELSAAPSGPTVQVGDVTYPTAQVGTLSGEVRARKLAPTLTLGWGGKLRRGFNLGIEAGAMFQGSPRINDLQATGALATNADFQRQLRVEERKIADEISGFKVYPILQLSAGYRF